jgi:hypothetical protein
LVDMQIKLEFLKKIKIRGRFKKVYIEACNGA